MSDLFLHAPVLHAPSPEDAPFYREAPYARLAREVAESWPGDALARERANVKPVAELQALRDSGLLKLLIPQRFGGLGGSLADAAQVIVVLAKQDASLAALLGFHYYASSVPRLSDLVTDAEAIERQSAQHNWLWGNIVQPFAPNFTATPTGDGGFIVRGFKKYNTGASYADITSVLAKRTDVPEMLYAFIEPDRTGVRFHDDWDHLGLRLADTRSVTFNDVELRPADIIPHHGVSRTNFPSLYLGYANTVYAALFVGSALGALAAARHHTLNHAKTPPGLKHVTDDPYIRQGYGQFAIELQAAEALLAQVAAEVARAYDERARLTEQRIGQIATRALALRGHAANTALRITAGIQALAGGVSTAATALGLERYWRDVRTLSLHDSLANAEGVIGLHYLSGKPFRLPDFVA